MRGAAVSRLAGRGGPRYDARTGRSGGGQKCRRGAVAVSGLLSAAPATAHHSFAAEYDAAKPVTLRGKVTKVEWINPHSWIYIEVKGKDGKVVTWAIEGGAPNALIRRGFKKDAVPIGTEIIVDGFRAKN